MKKVILYSGSYPYGKTTESFIGPELNVMSNSNEYEITIVPVVKDDYQRELPSSVKLDNSICECGILYKIKSCFGILNRLFIKELWKERKEITSFSYFLMAIKYLYATNLVLRDVEKRASAYENLTFYGFWLSYVPVAFAVYKINNPQTPHTFISRGHRCEVYTTELGLFYPLRRLLYNNIDKVYVCSDTGKDYLRNKYPFAANRITRAYLGVEENKREVTSNDSDCIKVVSCSSVYQFKRVDLILSSLSSFCRKHLEYSIEWTHFGGGTLFEELKTQVDECHVPNLTIKLMGSLDNNRILKYYREEYFDFFIHLSTSEGLPVSMMEAIASSIPVLATDVGGVSELVTEQTGKLLTVDFNQEEFDEALLYMINNRADLSLEAKKFFDANFNAKNNYPKFYKEITSL